MIASVTPSAVGAITGAFGQTLSAMIVIALLGLLIARELASAAGDRWTPLARGLPILIGPLLVSFTDIVLGRFGALH